MKKNSNIDMAIADLKNKCVTAYWAKQNKQSDLFSYLSNLSTKSEEKLTKKELFSLIVKSCDYMKALNIYNYYCGEYRKVLLDKGSIKINDLNAVGGAIHE